MQSLPPPNGVLLYLDTPEFFKDVGHAMYTTSPGGRIRPPENVAPLHKYLRPGTLALRTSEQGWVMDGNIGVVGDLLLILWLQHAD